MKRNKFLAYSLLLSFPFLGESVLTSCTDSFEDLNTSGIQVNPAELPFSAQCVEPMNYCYPPQQNLFQFWTNLNIDLYSGYFMTPNGNFTNGDLGENRGHSGGMYEAYYLHIFNNTRRIIAQCEESGELGLAGVMRVVQAYGTLMTTDAYGPLAYSSILSGEYESYYPFDSQQDLFKAMFDDIKKAKTDIAEMSAAEKTKLGTFDNWCNADTDLWIKVCNTMQLRLTLRLSKREDEMKAAGYDLKQLATEAADNTLANGGKDILIDKKLENEMWLMFNWGDCGFNANLVTLMSGMKDPRQPLFMTKNVDEVLRKDYTEKRNGAKYTYAYQAEGMKEPVEVTREEAVAMAPYSDYVGIRFGSGLPGKTNNWATFSYWIDKDNALGVYSMPLPIFKQAESYFLLAEAKLRWGIGSTSEKALYEEGIRTAIKNEIAYRSSYARDRKFLNYDEKGDPKYEDKEVKITDQQITDYISGTTTQIDFTDPVDPSLNIAAVNHVGVKWDEGADKEEKLERIITQKYLALFPLSTEAWAEQRRTGYPHLFPAKVNESNGAVNTEEGIRRLIYSSNASEANAKGYAEAIEILNKENSSKTGISGDKGGTRVWWDNANKGNF